jgi:hypothetical protein
MGHVRRGAGRAGAHLRQDQHTVISATLTLTALRRFSFRDTHDYLNFSLFKAVQADDTSLV